MSFSSKKKREGQRPLRGGAFNSWISDLFFSFLLFPPSLFCFCAKVSFNSVICFLEHPFISDFTFKGFFDSVKTVIPNKRIRRSASHHHIWLYNVADEIKKSTNGSIKRVVLAPKTELFFLL